MDRASPQSRANFATTTNEHPVFGHVLEGLPIQVAGKRDGILLSMSHRRHLKKSGIKVTHVRDQRLPLVEGALMVDDFPGALWARSHCVRRMMDSLMRGNVRAQKQLVRHLWFVRVGVCKPGKKDGVAATFNGASVITPSALGDPPAGIPLFSGAQDSLGASWGAPSKVGWVLKARSGESTLITIGLF